MTEDEAPGHSLEIHGAARRAPTRPPRVHHGAQERQAILVDARFWAWLNDEDAGGQGAGAARHTLQELLDAQGARVVRMMWYSDQDVEGSTPGLQHRRVPSHAQDQGVTMLRAMAQDLVTLAQHRAVERVLLVSDDDRLLLAVDQAQRCGLMVDMVVDADSQDIKALRADEPGWASLLLQADRLIVLGSDEAGGRTFRPRGAPSEARLRREAPSAQASGIIEDEILAWWDDETPDQRDHWRHEVQASRGIPQELDRQLLLRISRRLGQPLSPAEKSAMRQQVREQVMGPGDAGHDPMKTPEDA